MSSKKDEKRKKYTKNNTKNNKKTTYKTTPQTITQPIAPGLKEVEKMIDGDIIPVEGDKESLDSLVNVLKQS